MTDEDILRKIGLSDEELKEFLRKVNEFFNTLNEKERGAFVKGLKSVEQATRELDEDLTPQDLEWFIRRHEPTIIPPFFNCKKL
jgi:hypothetical protein